MTETRSLLIQGYAPAAANNKERRDITDNAETDCQRSCLSDKYKPVPCHHEPLSPCSVNNTSTHLYAAPDAPPMAGVTVSLEHKGEKGH